MLLVLDRARGRRGGEEWGRKRRTELSIYKETPLTPLLHGSLTCLDVTTRRNVMAGLSGRRGASGIPPSSVPDQQGCPELLPAPCPLEELWEGADSVLLDPQTHWGDKVQDGKSGCGDAEGRRDELHLLSTYGVPGTALITFTSVTSSNLPPDLVR